MCPVTDDVRCNPLLFPDRPIHRPLTTLSFSTLRPLLATVKISYLFLARRRFVSGNLENYVTDFDMEKKIKIVIASTNYR